MGKIIRRYILFILFVILAPNSLALQISFFEEFPTLENLHHLENVSFPTKLYLAASSTEEFKQLDLLITKSYPQVQEVIYWPILGQEEGYWISPWSNPEAMEKVFQEVHKENIPMMLDLELPQKRSLLWRYDRKQGKELISNFIKTRSGKQVLYTIEITQLPTFTLEWLGLRYEGTQTIRMYYSSFRREFLPAKIADWLFEQEAKNVARDGDILAIGLITSGINGKEPTYDVVTLEKELRIAQAAGVQEVVIFRLGGLTEEHAKVISLVTT